MHYGITDANNGEIKLQVDLAMLIIELQMLTMVKTYSTIQSRFDGLALVVFVLHLLKSSEFAVNIFSSFNFFFLHVRS